MEYKTHTDSIKYVCLFVLLYSHHTLSPYTYTFLHENTHNNANLKKRMLTIFALLTQEALWGFTQTILPECCFKEWI